MSNQSRSTSKRAARERLAEERKRQADAARRKERIIRGGVALAVVLAIVLVVVVVQVTRSSDAGGEDAALPQGVTEPAGPLVFGEEDAPVEVTLWEDFQCPACQAFEAGAGEFIRTGIEDGTIRASYHPISIIDTNLGNRSSLPAASAFACTVEHGTPEQALDFKDLVYERQPEETPGQEAWSNDDLAAWGGEVGVTGEQFESCVADEDFVDWAQNVDDSAPDAGVTATPTVLVNGEQIESADGTIGGTVTAFQAAVEAARSS